GGSLHAAGRRSAPALGRLPARLPARARDHPVRQRALHGVEPDRRSRLCVRRPAHPLWLRPMAEPALRPALRNGLVLFGTAIIVGMALLATFAGVVAPYDPTEMKVADALQRPSLAHLFGTDRFGRDVLSRTIYGSRIALGVAIASIGIALVVGTVLGLLGGYAGGVTDLVIGRPMDVLFSFPTLILAIGIAAMLGPGLDNAALAIAVVYAPLFSRVVRGPVIAERAKEYALAALGLGAGAVR